ncbi:MAG: phosphatidylserine decarboxylase [Pseudomonadota bacterium]
MSKEYVKIKDLFKPVLVPIHHEGWSFICLFTIIAFALGLLWAPSLIVSVVLVVWCIYFFRDPERITKIHPNGVISPADGVVQSIIECDPPESLKIANKGEWKRIAIFMNVFDVHVNRMPVAGKIIEKQYEKGKFLNASMDKASHENERCILNIESDHGEQIIVVQIAGLIARRILCWAKLNTPLKFGERFGMIRFGSRVDVYVPHHATIMVVEKQHMIAGETLIALLEEKPKQP